MVQKIHPRGVIWVPSSRLMWADHKKKMTAVPSIYKEVHVWTYQACNYSFKLLTCMAINLARDKVKLLKNLFTISEAC